MSDKHMKHLEVFWRVWSYRRPLWFQFRLRTLFILTAVVAVVCSLGASIGREGLLWVLAFILYLGASALLIVWLIRR